MTSIIVPLPGPLREWVETRARAEHAGDAAGYVRDLISRDRERSEAVARMQALLDEGFESGTCDQSLEEILAEARALARSQS